METNIIKLPQNNYSAGDLINARILKPGTPIVIEKNGAEFYYIPLGPKENGYLFINIQTNQIEPESVVLSGKISVRQPSQKDIQLIKTINPNLKDIEEARRYLKTKGVASVRIAETVVTGATSDYDGSTYRERALRTAFVETKTKIIRQSNINNSIGIAYEYSKKARIRGFLSTEAIDETINELKRISGLSSLDSQRKAIAEMARHQSEVMEVANRIRLGDESIESALERLRNLTPKDKIKYIIQGRNQRSTRVEISVVPEKDLAARLLEELDTRSPSRRLGLLYSRYGYGGPTEHIITEENVKNAVNVNQIFEQINRDTKRRAKISTPEALANFVKSRIIAGSGRKEFHGAMQREAQVIDAITNYTTHITNHPMVARPGFGGMLGRHTSLQFGALLTRLNRVIDPYTSKIQREIKTLSEAVNTLELAASDKIIDINGNIFDGSVDRYAKVLGSIDKTAIVQAIKAEQINREVLLKIERALVGEPPTRIMYGEGYATNGRRYSKPMTMSTGLFSVVGSMIGAYFYQSMLRHQYRNMENIYRTFHEPEEIIEAKKHSSVETSVRRLLSTDFGFKFSYVTSFIKGAFGRSHAQSIRKLFRIDNIDNIRHILDPVAASAKIKEWRTVIADRVKKLIDNKLNQKGDNLIREALEPVTRHWRMAAISAGSMLLLSKVGNSPGEVKKAQKERRDEKVVPQGRELQANFVFPHDFYQSQIRAVNRAVIGFGSPFMGIIDTIKAVGVLDVVRSRKIPELIRDIIHKGGMRIRAGVKLGIGMQNTGPYRTITSWSSSAIASDIHKSTAIAEITGTISDEVSKVTSASMLRKRVSGKVNLIPEVSFDNITRSKIKIPYTEFKQRKLAELEDVIIPHEWHYNKNIKLRKESKPRRPIPLADTSSSRIIETIAAPQRSISSIQQKTRNDILTTNMPKRIYSNSDMIEPPVITGRSVSSYIDPGIIPPTTTVKISPVEVHKATPQPIYHDIGEAVNKVMLSGAGTKNKYSNYSRGVIERIKEELARQ
jgi:hypothetical protein